MEINIKCLYGSSKICHNPCNCCKYNPHDSMYICKHCLYFNKHNYPLVIDKKCEYNLGVSTHYSNFEKK